MGGWDQGHGRLFPKGIEAWKFLALDFNVCYGSTSCRYLFSVKTSLFVLCHKSHEHVISAN